MALVFKNQFKIKRAFQDKIFIFWFLLWPILHVKKKVKKRLLSLSLVIFTGALDCKRQRNEWPVPLQHPYSFLAVDTFLLQCPCTWNEITDTGKWRHKQRVRGQIKSLQGSQDHHQGKATQQAAAPQNPHYNRSTPYHLLSRWEQVTISRLWTGHTHLKHHLFTKFGIGQSELCPWQICSMQTEHLLQAYLLLDNLRHHFWLVESDGQQAFWQPGWSTVHSSLCAENWCFHLNDWQDEEILSFFLHKTIAYISTLVFSSRLPSQDATVNKTPSLTGVAEWLRHL